MNCNKKLCKNYLKINYVEFCMHACKDHFFVFNFHFNLKFDWSSTNSKTCLKPLAQSKILWNIDIVDTRHLRQNLLLEAKSFFIKKHFKSYFYNYQQQSTYHVQHPS